MANRPRSELFPAEGSRALEKHVSFAVRYNGREFCFKASRTLGGWLCVLKPDCVVTLKRVARGWVIRKRFALEPIGTVWPTARDAIVAAIGYFRIPHQMTENAVDFSKWEAA